MSTALMAAGAASTDDWIEAKIAERHHQARLRLLKEMHQRHKTRRQQRRDVARVALVGAMVFLGVVMVEMGRKASHLLTTDTAIEWSYRSG